MQNHSIHFDTGNRIMIGEFGWFIGLHLVTAIWLGLLASTWKGRNTWVWIGIGLATSLPGLFFLARLPRLAPVIESEMAYQYLDGTRLQ